MTLRSEVLHTLVGEHPVLRVDGAGRDLLQERLPVQLRNEGHHAQGGDHEHDERGRQEAADASRPELRERDTAGARHLLQEVLRDQEARDDEEDVADEAAGEPVRPQVVDDNDEHGDCAQRLNLGAEGFDSWSSGLLRACGRVRARRTQGRQGSPSSVNGSAGRPCGVG